MPLSIGAISVTYSGNRGLLGGSVTGAGGSNGDLATGVLALDDMTTLNHELPAGATTPQEPPKSDKTTPEK